MAYLIILYLFIDSGRIAKKDLFAAIEKLESKNVEMKLPTVKELEQISKGVEQQDKDYFTYEEYLNLLMCVNTDAASDDDE